MRLLVKLASTGKLSSVLMRSMDRRLRKYALALGLDAESVDLAGFRSTRWRSTLLPPWRMDTPWDARYARASPEPRAGKGRAMRHQSAIVAIESIDRARAPGPIRFGPAGRWPRMDGPRAVVEARRS